MSAEPLNTIAAENYATVPENYVNVPPEPAVEPKSKFGQVATLIIFYFIIYYFVYNYGINK
jgi:hypothetical protein